MSSPYLNHFLQPDTIIPDLSNPQSWNRYSYVTNRPVNFNDPTGHKETTDTDGGRMREEEPCLVGDLACQLERTTSSKVHKGIKTVERYMDPDKDRIEVAAGIAVQSQYYGFWDRARFPFGSSKGIAQVTNTEMEEFGLNCNLDEASCSISAMAKRIDLVLKWCKLCSPEDKLVAAALAQNGGFSGGDMQALYNNRIEGNIDWDTYFFDRAKTANFDIRMPLRGIDYQVYDTRFMVLKYTEDMITLQDRDWSLPWGLTADQVVNVQERYGGK